MTLRIDRDGDVLHLTLARPESRNALAPDLVQALTEAFSDVGNARAVVLAGDGRSFCAGGDLGEMQTAATASPDETLRHADGLRVLLESVTRCPALVICRVQGHAIGAGAALAASCDTVLAQEEALFAFPEVKIGLVPFVVLPAALARIGERNARRYLVTGEMFDAPTAQRIGLVDDVVPDLDVATDHVLAQLLSAAPQASRVAKQLILEHRAEHPFAQRDDRLLDTAESEEGFSAFLERRKPNWSL